MTNKELEGNYIKEIVPHQKKKKNQKVKAAGSQSLNSIPHNIVTDGNSDVINDFANSCEDGSERVKEAGGNVIKENKKTSLQTALKTLRKI